MKSIPRRIAPAHVPRSVRTGGNALALPRHLLVLWALSCAGCSLPAFNFDAPEPDADASDIVPADTTLDTTTDSGVDTTTDSGVDTTTDSGVDTTTDSRPDATLDAPGEAAADASPDAAGDTATDAPGDVAVDVPGDGGGPACGADVDLQTDPRHCGRCDNDCSTLGHIADYRDIECRSGTCFVPESACETGWSACMGSSLGCITDIRQDTRCGSCGASCSGATPVCVPPLPAPADGGAGTSWTCAPSCPGAVCGARCADLARDPENCGACGNVCTTTVAHGQATCAMGACTFRCVDGYGESAGVCATLSAPRQLAPISGSTMLTTQVRMYTTPFVAGQTILWELCLNRECTGPYHRRITSTSGMDYGLVRGAELLPGGGAYYWRVRRQTDYSRSSYSPWWEMFAPQGVQANYNAWIGTGVHPDFDGDSRGDVLVGAPNRDPAAAGGVYAFPDLPGGTRAVLTSSPGGATASHFGRVVSAAGDVNGDGYVDAILGGDGAATGTNRVLSVYHGSAAGLGSAPATTLSVPTDAVSFGFAVSAAGDVNRDGYADVVVGDPDAMAGLGRIHVFYGSARGLEAMAGLSIVGTMPGGHFGYSVSSAGEFDLNRVTPPRVVEDVIVGAPDAMGGTGMVFVFPGEISTGLRPTPMWSQAGHSPGGRFGSSVALAGDVNHDSFTDVVVTEPGATPNAEAWVFFTGEATPGTPNVLSSARLVTTTPGSSTAVITAVGVGDLDHDGADEVAIGEPAADRATGLVSVFRGVLGGGTTATGRPGIDATSVASLQVAGPDGINGQFGGTLAASGDIDADRCGELVVGAPAANAGRGAVYVVTTSCTARFVTPPMALPMSDTGAPAFGAALTWRMPAWTPPAILRPRHGAPLRGLAFFES